MTNFIQQGNNIDITAAAAIASGEVVVVGSLAGVAVTSCESGEKVAICVNGVFNVPKGSSAFVAGAKVYYDETNDQTTSTATGNTFLGYATDAVVAGDTSVNVLLARPGS